MRLLRFLFCARYDSAPLVSVRCDEDSATTCGGLLNECANYMLKAVCYVVVQQQVSMLRYALESLSNTPALVSLLSYAGGYVLENVQLRMSTHRQVASPRG